VALISRNRTAASGGETGQAPPRISHKHFESATNVLVVRVKQLAILLSNLGNISWLLPCPATNPWTPPQYCHMQKNAFFVQFKIWVKPSSEQSFLYGNHVLKSGLGRITDNTPKYQGVVVYSMADVPLVSWFFFEIYASTIHRPGY